MTSQQCQRDHIAMLLQALVIDASPGLLKLGGHCREDLPQFECRPEAIEDHHTTIQQLLLGKLLQQSPLAAQPIEEQTVALPMCSEQHLVHYRVPPPLQVLAAAAYINCYC